MGTTLPIQSANEGGGPPSPRVSNRTTRPQHRVRSERPPTTKVLVRWTVGEHLPGRLARREPPRRMSGRRTNPATVMRALPIALVPGASAGTPWVSSRSRCIAAGAAGMTAADGGAGRRRLSPLAERRWGISPPRRSPRGRGRVMTSGPANARSRASARCSRPARGERDGAARPWRACPRPLVLAQPHLGRRVGRGGAAVGGAQCARARAGQTLRGGTGPSGRGGLRHCPPRQALHRHAQRGSCALR